MAGTLADELSLSGMVDGNTSSFIINSTATDTHYLCIFSKFFSRVNSSVRNHCHNVTVNDMCMAVRTQKKNKSVGPNGIYTESFIYGGVILNVHLRLLFAFRVPIWIQEMPFYCFMH